MYTSYLIASQYVYTCIHVLSTALHCLGVQNAIDPVTACNNCLLYNVCFFERERRSKLTTAIILKNRHKNVQLRLGKLVLLNIKINTCKFKHSQSTPTKNTLAEP